MCVCVYFFSRCNFHFRLLNQAPEASEEVEEKVVAVPKERMKTKWSYWLLNFTHSNWDLNFFPFHLLFFLFLFFFHSNFSFSLDLPFHLSKGQRCVEQIRRITTTAAAALTAVVEKMLCSEVHQRRKPFVVCALHSTIVCCRLISVYMGFFICCRTIILST